MAGSQEGMAACGVRLVGRAAEVAVLEAVLGERAAASALVLDDMQWADASALDLLVHAARLVPGLLIVVIFRGGRLDLDDPLAIRLARVGRVRSCMYLLLEGLSREEAAELLERAASRELE